MSAVCRPRRAWLPLLALAALAAALAPPAPAAVSSERDEQPASPAAGSEPQVFVPIRQPRVEKAPTAVPRREPKRSAPARAIEASVETAATVPFVQIPGTSVPIWWLTVMLLSVPIARLWRRWTASMFA